MNSPTYRIKPLVFTKQLRDGSEWRAVALDYEYYVYLAQGAWRTILRGYPNLAKFKTFDAAVEYCNADIRERIMEGLEVVEQDSGPTVNCIDAQYCPGCEHCIPAKARTK